MNPPEKWSAADVERWFIEDRKVGRAVAEEFEDIDGVELLSIGLPDFVAGEERLFFSGFASK